MSASDYTTSRGLNAEPHWHRRSVFYEAMVRAFADSNGDGTGDFVGLISKLDYLQRLGIDAMWIPPFFASPLRDGGYDVADYKAVLPEFGTIDDFIELVTRAHERGIRIVIDLVLNHTSDQHDWFQQSRHHPEGPYGDFYVWEDTDEKWLDIRLRTRTGPSTRCEGSLLTPLLLTSRRSVPVLR